MQEHHYLPQFYQRCWAGEDKHVFVYHRPYDRVIVSKRQTRSTGRVPGLYTIVGVAPERVNELENHFWRIVDQRGVDALDWLKNGDADADQSRKVRVFFAIFILSLLFRNPRCIAFINGEVKKLHRGISKFLRFL